MILDKQFLLIIGAPRSGTTWLQAMVGAHPLICTTDELKLFDFFTGPWAKSWESLLRLQKDGRGARRHGLTGVWSEDEFRHFLREFLERVYTRVLERKPEAMVILDKTPGYSEYVEHINWLIPQAKFIHLIRDGRDVVVSLQAASQGWGELWAPNKVESAAFLWKSALLAARKGQQYTGRYMEVRYEELLTNGAQILSSIFDFVGVPAKAVNAAAIFQDHQFQKMKQEGAGVQDFGLPKEFFRKGQAGDWQNALSPQQRYFINEIAGDLLGELGYAGNSWWVERWHQRFTLPLIAMLQSRSRMRSKTLQTVTRALGPVWIERIRAARTWLRPRHMGDEQYKARGGAGTP
jgi:LPS sulfotransferase NodH